MMMGGLGSGTFEAAMASLMAKTIEKTDDAQATTTRYASRHAPWHLTCCQTYRASVRFVSPRWWASTAYNPADACTYNTGGQTRRHAETNALNLAGAPMHAPSVFSTQYEPDGPS